MVVSWLAVDTMLISQLITTWLLTWFGGINEKTFVLIPSFFWCILTLSMVSEVLLWYWWWDPRIDGSAHHLKCLKHSHTRFVVSNTLNYSELDSVMDSSTMHISKFFTTSELLDGASIMDNGMYLVTMHISKSVITWLVE